MAADDSKKKAGVYAAGLVEPGMQIGLGTGTTVYWLILELGMRVRQGMPLTVVPTSRQTERLAQENGLSISGLDNVERLALAIDGADEIDPTGQLIKGGGGALLQEKIVAAAADRFVVIADASKLVPSLGRFPLPVEVIPFGHVQVMRRILQSGLCKKIQLREKEGRPFISDHGHYILDCEYGIIENAAALNSALHAIPGVVETGLFLQMANEAIIGQEDGTIRKIVY